MIKEEEALKQKLNGHKIRREAAGINEEEKTRAQNTQM